MTFCPWEGTGEYHAKNVEYANYLNRLWPDSGSKPQSVCYFEVRLVGEDQDLDELDYAIDLMSSFRKDAPNDGAESPWMTPAEAAREVGLTPHAIRAWIARGELPAERTGPRRLRIRRSDLEQLLRAVRQSHGPARSEAEQADISVLQRPPTPGARLIEMQGTSDG
jgi:excisionase family DNA binding protein